MSYQSTKLFEGFSTCFRQWKAIETHCKFLHGYGVSFKVTYEGELDEKNWVFDHGGMKRAKGKIDGMNPKEWMDYMFDHTTILAEDDPELSIFKMMHDKGILQLRILPAVGTERFAEYLFTKLNTFVKEETNNRVRVVQVEFFEHNKNSSIFKESTVIPTPPAKLFMEQKDYEDFVKKMKKAFPTSIPDHWPIQNPFQPYSPITTPNPFPNNDRIVYGPIIH